MAFDPGLPNNTLFVSGGGIYYVPSGSTGQPNTGHVGSQRAI